MNNEQTILKEQISKLSKKMRGYVLGNIWTDQLEKILSNFELQEYQKIAIENEVLLILMGLEPYTDLTENISKEAEVDFNMAKWISEDVIKNILEPLAETEESENKKTPQPQNNVGTEF